MVFVEQKGRKPLIELEMVRGLGLLCARIPILPDMKESAFRRRVVRAARLLGKAGVRRVLVGTDFAWWPVLREWGLGGVDAAPLCELLASKLALALLARRGIPAAQATVALRGNRVSRPFFQAAMELASAVRALVVVSPNGGEALSAYLRSEYGLPVLEEGAGVESDVTLEFSILKGGDDGALILHGSPNLRGLRVDPADGMWPEGFEPLSLAAALWEAGELPISSILCT